MSLAHANASNGSRSKEYKHGIDIGAVRPDYDYVSIPSSPHVAYLKPILPIARTMKEHPRLAFSFGRPRREIGANDSLGRQKIALLAFLWLALALLLLVDLLTPFAMWATYTIPTLIAAALLRRNHLLPLATVAFVLAVVSVLHHHGDDGAGHAWVRIGSAACIILLASRLAQHPPIAREKTSPAATASRRKPFDTSEQESGATEATIAGTNRPLAVERRKNRHLPEEVSAQMEELESLTRRLIQIQEEQKQTISRELHDNVAQVLTVVNARMTLARTAQAKIPAWLKLELNEFQEHINLALTDIRTLARELRPSLLDHCGFAAALEKHVQGFRERTGTDLALELDGEAAVSFDSESLTHLFRLVQEALQNIEEHSGASRAWLRLARQEGEMHLEIGDNGRAFTEERLVEAQRDGHLGLLGMRERTELLGGTFLLEAVPGRGTVIRIAIPPPPRKTRVANALEQPS